MTHPLVAEFALTETMTFAHSDDVPVREGRQMTAEDVLRNTSAAFRALGVVSGHIIAVGADAVRRFVETPIGTAFSSVSGGLAGHLAVQAITDNRMADAGAIVASAMIATAISRTAPRAISAVGAGLLAIGGRDADAIGRHASGVLCSLSENSGIPRLAGSLETWRARGAAADSDASLDSSLESAEPDAKPTR